MQSLRHCFLGLVVVLIRLGHVIYWLGLGIAVLCAAGVWAVVFFTHNDREVGFAFAAAAALSWLFGRASRYVLSGD